MDPRTIVVKGTGKISTPPDQIVVELNLEVASQQYDEAMELSTNQVEAIRQAIVRAGHEGKALTTGNFTVNTKYDSFHDNDGNWRQKFVGYECLHALRLEFDLDLSRLSATLEAITDCGAKPNLSILFSVKDKDLVTRELLKKAVQEATDKAETLAETSGVTLGDIHNIDYNWSEHHLYSDTRVALGAPEMRGAAPVPATLDISPEDIHVRDTVTVTWMIS
jgi:uncharacterized protein YggE